MVPSEIATGTGNPYSSCGEVTIGYGGDTGRKGSGGGSNYTPGGQIAIDID